MGIVLRIRQPMDSDVRQVAIQYATSSAATSGTAISGSPFYLKTGGVFVSRFEDASGTLSRYYRFQYLDDAGNTGSWSSWYKPEGATYCSTRDVWDWLNVRNEIVNESVTTAGDGSTSFYSLTKNNIIDGTYEVKYGSTTSATELTEETHYNIDLDRGWLKLTTAGAAAISGSAVFADYRYADIPDSVVKQFIQGSDAHIEEQTSRKWHKFDKTEYLPVEYGKDGEVEKDYISKFFPIITISSLSYQSGDAGSAETWNAMTEGYANDYWADEDDKAHGIFHLTGKNLPSVGERKLKLEYQHGYDPIPQPIKTLSTQISIVRLVQHPIWAQHFIKGKNTFINLELTPLKADIDLQLKQIRKNAFVKA